MPEKKKWIGFFQTSTRNVRKETKPNATLAWKNKENDLMWFQIYFQAKEKLNQFLYFNINGFYIIEFL